MSAAQRIFERRKAVGGLLTLFFQGRVANDNTEELRESDAAGWGFSLG